MELNGDATTSDTKSLSIKNKFKLFNIKISDDFFKILLYFNEKTNLIQSSLKRKKKIKFI